MAAPTINIIIQAAQAATLREWRCSRCNRLLMRVRLGPGTTIEKKCEKCSQLHTLETQGAG